MLTRLLRSQLATSALGIAVLTAAGAIGVLIVVCLLIGAAHLLIWIGGII